MGENESLKAEASRSRPGSDFPELEAGPGAGACPICGGAFILHGTARVLSRFTAIYLRCSDCGFITAQNAQSWLAEAYENAITPGDLGLVARSLRMADVTDKAILLFANPRGKFCDWGGGYGLLVRILRDRGYDFRRFDKYCPNIFAQAFDCKRLSGQYEMITAFETVEHLPDPVTTAGRILEHTDRFLFSTLILPDPCPAPEDWWYFGLHHGQHISLFTIKSLRCLAHAAGMHFYTDGTEIHLFSRKKLGMVKRRLLFNAFGRRLLDIRFYFSRPQSLLPQDCGHDHPATKK